MTNYDEIDMKCASGNSVAITIPIEYIDWVSIGKKQAEIFFDADAIPKAWEVCSMPVPLDVALDAARKIAQAWAADI